MIKITFFVALVLFAIFSVVASTFAVAQAPPSKFNLTRAIDSVYYSKIAYCEMKNVEMWNCAACSKFPNMKNVSTAIVEAHASSAWVGFDAARNQAVVAFTGTIDLQGWIEDFDFFKTEYEPSSGCGSDCYVHQGLYWGYLELMKTLWPKLLSILADHPDADVLCTGHSMGAAQAGFCQMDIVRKLASHKGTKRTYTFGEPRIATVKTVIWQQEVLKETESFRATNYGDPVVHLPPIVFDELDLGQWIHNPREIFYQDNFGPAQNYKICDGGVRVINGTKTVVEDKTCADSTPIWRMSFKYHTTYLDIGMGCFL